MSEYAIDALTAIRRAMDQAAAAAGRGADQVNLVAVSKTHDAAVIRPFLAAGQRLFGENRVQEARGKWPELKQEYPDVRLHLIGPLQTNKVREAAALFDVVETVDRPKLARALADEIQRSGKSLRCLIQVNVGREPQKAGIDPDQVDALAMLCRRDYHLPVDGLMCIPPAEGDPAHYFKMLADMAERLGFSVLSMGMSGDFQAAIAQGATHVRVGSALFGRRDHP
jgi:PLP dependent protein